MINTIVIQVFAEAIVAGAHYREVKHGHAFAMKST